MQMRTALLLMAHRGRLSRICNPSIVCRRSWYRRLSTEQEKRGMERELTGGQSQNAATSASKQQLLQYEQVM
jgi:hypothetical protein